MNHLGDTNKMVGEDHIRDATKMVSDTPRTDSLLTAILDSDGFVHNGNCPQRWVNYARELERELNAANERIKRLEEAGDRMRLFCADPDDCFAWDKARKDNP